MQDRGQEGRRRRGDCEEAPVVGDLAELESPVGPRAEHLFPRRQGTPLLPGRRILADVPLLFLRDEAIYEKSFHDLSSLLNLGDSGMVFWRAVDQEYVEEEPNRGGRGVGVEGNLPTEFRGDDSSQDQPNETA